MSSSGRLVLKQGILKSPIICLFVCLFYVLFLLFCLGLCLFVFFFPILYPRPEPFLVCPTRGGVGHSDRPHVLLCAGGLALCGES